MAVVALSNTVVLGSTWHKVSLGSEHSCFLVGVKEAKGAQDTIDPNKIKRISFELGIDAGISTPLSIGFVTLNFDDRTSSEEDINSITAMLKLIGYPSEFQLRPTQIYTDDNQCYTEGQTSIGINLIPVSFH